MHLNTQPCLAKIIPMQRIILGLHAVNFRERCVMYFNIRKYLNLDSFFVFCLSLKSLEVLPKKKKMF